MATKDVQAIFVVFNFCSWIIGAICRFSTGLFSPTANSPLYYHTLFGLHVNPVTTIFAVILTIGSLIFGIVSLAVGELIPVLIGLLSIAFSVSLTYASFKQKAAFYLPTLVSFHVFLVCGLVIITLQMVVLIWEVNRDTTRGYRGNSGISIEKKLALIFYCQLKLVGLCIFGYLSNIIFRDYMYVKNARNPAIESTPSTVSKSDLETKEQHDAAGIPNLYV